MWRLKKCLLRDLSESSSLEEEDGLFAMKKEDQGVPNVLRLGSRAYGHVVV